MPVSLLVSSSKGLSLKVDYRVIDVGYIASGRGIAQLVERRSPKPQVPGSSPGAPAIRCKAQESLHNL